MFILELVYLPIRAHAGRSGGGGGGGEDTDQIWVVWGVQKPFLSLKLGGQSEVRTRDLWLSKQAALTTTPGPGWHGANWERSPPKDSRNANIF